MTTPYEVLGVRAWATEEEIHSAYRTMVKACHPDRFQDPARKRTAQEQMIRLNLAYEEALRRMVPRSSAPASRELDAEDAVALAEKMLERGNPECALRELARCPRHTAPWYYTQGRVMMRMEEFETAHQCFREAVRLSPEDNEYHRCALEAAVAIKKSRTIPGRVHRIVHHLRKK